MIALIIITVMNSLICALSPVMTTYTQYPNEELWTHATLFTTVRSFPPETHPMAGLPPQHTDRPRRPRATTNTPSVHKQGFTRQPTRSVFEVVQLLDGLVGGQTFNVTFEPFDKANMKLTCNFYLANEDILLHVDQRPNRALVLNSLFTVPNTKGKKKWMKEVVYQKGLPLQFGKINTVSIAVRFKNNFKISFYHERKYSGFEIFYDAAKQYINGVLKIPIPTSDSRSKFATSLDRFSNVRRLVCTGASILAKDITWSYY